MSAVFATADRVIVWVPEGRSPKGFAWSDRCWPKDWEPRPVLFYTSAGVPRPIKWDIENGATFIAHNAEGFDAPAWELLVGGPQPTWYDTIHAARAAGLPAGLDKACRALGVPGKSDEGKRALKMLYTAKMKGRDAEYPVGTVPLWETMLAYNVGDVLGMEELYRATVDCGEPDVLDAHCAVNSRGCPIDLAFAGVLRKLWTIHQDQSACEVEAHIKEIDGVIAGGFNPRSAAAIKKWLAGIGLAVPSLNRAAVEEMIRDPEGAFGDTDDPRVITAIAVIRARQQAALATPGKVDRAIQSCDPDGRARGLFVYHGAHTGRWSGRDIQPHNFPRGTKGDVGAVLATYHERGDLSLDDVRSAFPGKPAGDALATLMRPVIRAGPGKRLVVIDYGSVEARGLAWAAREQRALDVFSDPHSDIYCDMAGKLYGKTVTKKDERERQVGKTIVLGCGYQMGANKFAASCSLQGVDLAAAGTTADACVKAYREGYPAIPALWRDLDRAARMARRGITSIAGRCVFSRTPDVLIIQLPSGRKLRYRKPGIEMQVPAWGGDPRETLTYEAPHGYRKALYGGLLAENIVQALCRDLLATALVQLDPIYPVVLHVHDELVMEVDEGIAGDALRDAGIVMSAPPDWADGFPLRVEGFVTEHYGKAAPRGAPKVDAMLGRVM
jgi:DNA polymerase